MAQRIGVLMDSSNGLLCVAGSSSAQQQGATRRPNRVRSQQRRRGSRGKGGSKKHAIQQKQQQSKQQQAREGSSSLANGVVDGSCKILLGGPSACQLGIDQPQSHLDLEHSPDHTGSNNGTAVGPGSERPKKRLRERKNRKWKPYSEMTWEEK